MAAGFGVTLALAVTSESGSTLAAPGGWATAAGRVTGMLGAYLLMVMIVLVARLPAVERVIGHDKLVALHRRVAPWALVAIVAHAVLITVGYAAAAKTGALAELWTILTGYPGMITATVALVLLVVAGVTSIRYARRAMRHETWWIVHLYAYLALALGFSHQIATGQSFAGHPAAQAFWIALWASTAGVVLVYRVGLPLIRSLRHRLVVVGVYNESPDTYSIVLRGRKIDRLAVSGGQFFQWRFLQRGLWWQAHPYSLSALPAPPYLRVTIKVLGDHSAILATLKRGTRVAIEGPYGAFTKHVAPGRKVLLVGAGVGVTPIRAMLEDLEPGVSADVIVRASTPADLVLHDELRDLVGRRNGALHEMVGPRADVPLHADVVRRLVPDIAERSVFLCGPEGFVKSFITVARALGVTPHRIHHEQFAF
jgi:predicted ferric reductase